MITIKKIKYILICSCILLSIASPVLAVFGPVAPYGTGVLTITNQTMPRLYTLGSNGITLDSSVNFSFNASVQSSWVRYATDSVQKTAWPGGALYVTIDRLTNDCAYDRLTCTLANPVMTSSYNITKRILTITANSTVTYTDIQSTLRTLKFSSKGQNSGIRNIRIWVEQQSSGGAPAYSYRFVNSNRFGRTPRVYCVVAQTRPDLGNIDAMNWTQALADANAQPTRYGLDPYFASIGNAEEEAACQEIENGANLLGGKALVAAAYTGAWVWADGPDQNKQFSTGSTVYTADGLNFEYWFPGASEPNGGLTGALAKETGTGRRWNDNSLTAAYEGYWMAYGGQATDTNVITVIVVAPNTLQLSLPY